MAPPQNNYPGLIEMEISPDVISGSTSANLFLDLIFHEGNTVLDGMSGSVKLYGGELLINKQTGSAGISWNPHLLSNDYLLTGGGQRSVRVSLDAVEIDRIKWSFNGLPGGGSSVKIPLQGRLNRDLTSASFTSTGYTLAAQFMFRTEDLIFERIDAPDFDNLSPNQKAALLRRLAIDITGNVISHQDLT